MRGLTRGDYPHGPAATVCAGFHTLTREAGKFLGGTGREGFGRLSGERLFARFYPQPIMRRIANSLRCGAATFAGFER
ncbi:hypothetical protein GCM10010104_56240 [Streptomyces indiaensis]|uniref:Uncharacterized protein n=1 Tax=Streptomyces indiaensis TaxID=284033 RepID=A0ABP5R5L6_9ACTN